jgi:hypothetical protein
MTYREYQEKMWERNNRRPFTRHPEDFLDPRPRWVSLHAIEVERWADDFEKFIDEVDARTKADRFAIAFETDQVCDELSMTAEELEAPRKREENYAREYKRLRKLMKPKTEEDEREVRRLASFSVILKR